MFSGGIGLPEVLLVLAIVLIIFGPKRLPQLGRSLGSGMRNFKESVSGRHKDDDDDDDHAELTAAKPDDRPAGERPVNEPVGRSGE
ncbi:MAG: twin-arginine translocase TatA/TatE family subunit [Solirubrobacteraceae bacterium]